MSTYVGICTDEDSSTLHRLRDESEAWLGSKGVDQFQGGTWSQRAHKNIDKLLTARRFVALRNLDGEVLSVGALVGPDMDFWCHDDDLGSAWYISRLMVASHGIQAGSQLLNALALAAHLDGRQYLRLDCWRTNTALHEYYESQGFAPLRVEHRPHRRSGALFQRRCAMSGLPGPWDKDV